MKRLTWGVVAAGIVSLSLALMDLDAGHSRGKDRDDGVFRVSRRDMSFSVKATGVIKPKVGAEVKVGSRASGVVARLYVQIGDIVEKGQLLAALDARELAARRNQAAAALELSLANLEFARADLARKVELGREELIAPQDLDLAQRAYAVARQEKVQAEAELEYATTELGYARIEAPISGVVGSISTQEGETVTASLASPTFVTLIDLKRLEVWAYVDETDIGRIQAGERARFAVDTYRDEEFSGEVTAIYPRAEIRDNVVDYVAVISFTPPEGKTLRPEMTTTVTLLAEERGGVLAVPVSAVHREGRRAFVRRLRKGQATDQDVTLGVKGGGYVEILGGLDDGDEISVAKTVGGGGNAF